MSAEVYRELLRDFRAAEAEWPVKGHTQFKIWARPFTNGDKIETGWLPRSNEKYEEWHLASFRVDSREWGYHVFTHIGCVRDDEQPVERFTELANKAGAHLSRKIQSRISPEPSGSINWWLALMWRLHPAADDVYFQNPRIFLDNPFFDSANTIEQCLLHTDAPVWPGDYHSPRVEPEDNGKEGTNHRRKKRRRTKPRPLTPKQAEVVQVVADCEGNYAKAARKLGKDRSTIKQSYEAAQKKLNLTVIKHATTQMREDLRGQANVDAKSDRRPGGHGGM